MADRARPGPPTSGHASPARSFGNIRRLPSGRYQASYLGPDGQRRYVPETYERKGDAERALVLIEAQISAGEWTDPERGKVKLAWIKERPGLRPRSADNYRWLLKKHVVPHLGAVPVGKMSTPAIREWRATLLDQGVSVSTVAKAYRFLRAVLMTAVDEDKILPRNPCCIRGAGDEVAPERLVLTVAQVFELAERVGRPPVGNIRKVAGGGYRLRFRRHGEMRRRQRSTATGQRPSGRCGRWQTTAGPTATITGGSGRWCCWRRSQASGGRGDRAAALRPGPRGADVRKQGR